MDRRGSSSWDKTAFVREPLDRTLCRPRPSGSASENHSAAQDHDRLEQQRGPPTGGRDSHAHAGGLSPFWAIRPPCMSSCGNFSVRQESTSAGTVDHSWACDMVATNSNFNNGSDFARCPTLRDAPDSGSDSDASMDAEVASLTSGRRLGMDHKDASMLLGPRYAVRARAGYMPVVTPPSRNREAESVEAFFALLSSPTAEQQQQCSSSSSSITPSPTDGYSTPAAGHLMLGRNAALNLEGRGARLSGDSGRAGAGVMRGEVPANERGAKRQRFGASASASRCNTSF